MGRHSSSRDLPTAALPKFLGSNTETTPLWGCIFPALVPSMAFADPQTVTINAVANTLPRTGFQPAAGIFTKDDGNVKLSIANTYAKRTRRSCRLDFSKIAADPLISAQNIKYSMSAYLVVDVPVTGFTVAEQKQIVDALTLYLTASSGAKVTQLLGGEV